MASQISYDGKLSGRWEILVASTTRSFDPAVSERRVRAAFRHFEFASRYSGLPKDRASGVVPDRLRREGEKDLWQLLVVCQPVLFDAAPSERRVSAMPLLIIDDLGMRKLPHTAAEDLL